MQVTGTQIAYYNICHRKLWLFSNGVTMEQTSDLVSEGKLIAETTYLDRSRKYTELEIDSIKIDFYDARNRVIYEVKKSNALDKAHIAQVKYYMYVLSKHGVETPSAILEYPKIKHRELVAWNDNIITQVEAWEKGVELVLQSHSCPSILLNNAICKKCSYYEFCYVGEEVKL